MPKHGKIKGRLKNYFQTAFLFLYFVSYNSNPNNFACFNRAFQLIRIRDNPK